MFRFEIKPSVKKRILPIFFLGVSIFALWEIFKLEIGTFKIPGPGLWPAIVSIILLILASILSILGDDDKYVPVKKKTPKIIFAILSLTVFFLVFEKVGFILPAMLLIFLWLKLIANETLKKSILLGLIVPIAIYILFVLILNVPFPTDYLVALFANLWK